MDTPILNRLREHLACINAEQFQQEWAEIEAMGNKGPSIEDFLKSLRLTPTIKEIIPLQTFGTSITEEFTASPSSSSYNYVIAA